MSIKIGRKGGPAGATVAFDHALTETDDGTTECTIYPRDCAESELTTHWLTAKSGAFVSLAEVR